jgi:hypothetical protein
VSTRKLITVAVTAILLTCAMVWATPEGPSAASDPDTVRLR